MDERDWLTQHFEEKRTHLRAVAYRMLGSISEADDAVQEAWLRLQRSDTSGVGNLGGWLTTVVSRVCLDMLRSRKSRREESMEHEMPEPTMGQDADADPERGALLADSVGLALLTVLETLPPAERVAFVLHDMFDLSFDEIAPIVGRSTVATRQLASRARRRVQGASTRETDRTRQREVVDAFLAASRGGSFDALLALLDPNVVLRADPAAVRTGATEEVRGASEVAKMFAGRARFAQTALVDGVVGAVWAPGGRARVVFGFTIADRKILAIDLIADSERLGRMDVTVLSE